MRMSINAVSDEHRVFSVFANMLVGGLGVILLSPFLETVVYPDLLAIFDQIRVTSSCKALMIARLWVSGCVAPNMQALR